MRTWLNFGAANTGLVIGDLTYYAYLLSDATAADFTGATLTEVDATNLPGVYIFDAYYIQKEAQGRVWVTADANAWDELTFRPSVWDELKADHTVGDSFGGSLQNTEGMAQSMRDAIFPLLGILSQFSAQISGWNFTTGVFTASFSGTIPAGGKMYCCPYSAANGAASDEPWEINPPDVLTVNDTGVMWEQVLALCIQGGTAASTPGGTLTMTCTDCRSGETTQTISITTPAVGQGESSYFFVARDGTCYATGGVPQGSGTATQMPDGDFYAEANP